MTQPNINPTIAYLANIIDNQRAGPSNMDMAKYILANSTVKFNTTPPVDFNGATASPHIGLLSRVVDLLSRPNYAVANAFNDITLSKNPLTGFFRGLEGKDKTTFSDVIGDNIQNPVAKGLLGFGLDVALDPTTYIGAGAISKGLSKGGKLIGLGKKALELPEKPLAQQAIREATSEIPKFNRVASPEQQRLLNSAIESLPSTSEPVFNLPNLNQKSKAAAEEISGNIPGSKSVVNTNFPNSVNPGQQVKIFKNILGEAQNLHPNDLKKQLTTAHSMLSHAENTLEQSGKTLRYWDGQPFKLSDLLSEMDFGKDVKTSRELVPTLEKELKKVNIRLKNPEFARAFDTVRTRSGLKNSQQLQGAISKILEENKQLGPDTRLEKLFRNTPSIAERQGVKLPPVAEVASEAQKGLLNELMGVVPSVVEKAKPVIKLNETDRTVARQLSESIPEAKARVNKQFPGSVNPHQQLKVWKTVLGYAKSLFPKDQAKSFDKAYQMLIHTEDILEAEGKNPRYWDGANFKLSDVIAEMVNGKGIKFTKEVMPKIEHDLKKVNVRFKDPDVAQSFHNVRVRSAVLDSPAVKDAINAALKEKETVGELPISEARLSKLFKAIPSLAERHSLELGASGAGASAAKSMAKEVVKQQKQSALDSAQAVKKAMQIPDQYFRKPMNGLGKVEEGLGARILSWYGQKDLRPITEQHLMTASNSSWLRSAALKKFTDGFSDSQKLEGVRFAQGLPGAKPTQLGMVFKQTIENLFRGSGLTEAVWKSNTVTGRAELIMTRLNAHLKYVKSPWQFTNKAIKHPITGIVTDYSKDHNWLKSWQSWDVKNPDVFFPMIQGAVETATHEKAIFDDIAERFGSKIRGNGYNQTIEHPYLAGVYFTKDIAQQVPRVVRDMDDFFDGGANSKFIKQFDKISRAWKFSVTLPNPSHHIRNLLGDSYLNWMAGVNSIQPYKYALQILRSQRHDYEGLNDVERIVQTGAVDKAMAKTPNAKDILFNNKSGKAFTAEQIYVGAHQMGILPQAHVIEDILGTDTPLIKGFQPFGGKVKASLESFSELREHFARLAHFTDVVRKSSGNDYQEIFRKAGFTVRKWHPDYLTLTPFEKKFLRRIMPFYSWTRRAIPLVIESAILNPGKTLVYPKAIQSIQDMMGIDTPSRTDPFPTNQRFPDWIRDLGVGPIFDHPALGARSFTDIFGQQVGDTIVNPSNPTFDIGSQFSNPLQGVGELLHPAIKIPIELLTKKQINTEAPITKDNLMEYLGNQLPLFSTFQGISGVTPALGSTSRAKHEGGVNLERIINYLTALGVRGTGPYIKQARIEQSGG